MSNNIKVQMYKTGPNAKLDYILNSYNSLKLILIPNLNEKNIIFMNSIIDIIISQLETFIELLYINETKKIYELLNINNQNLSKQIAGIYEDIKLNKYSVNSSTDKDKIDSQIYLNKKESDLLEQQKESFSIINSSNYNKYNDNDVNNTKKKEINKKDKIKAKDKNINKLKEKEKLIQNLKELEKEKSKEIREKARILIRKKNSKTKLNNCSKLTKNSQQSEIKSIISNNSSSKTEIASKNLCNNRFETEEKITKINDYKFRYISPFKLINKTNYNSKGHLKENDKKFKRSKTQLYESLLGIDPNGNMLPMNVSISFTNRLLDRIKKPSKKKKNESIQMVLEDNNNLKGYRNYQNNNYTPKTEINKSNKIFNKNEDYFSLDKFLTPYNKKGEQMFLTKEGKVLINKKEKDILEDYINNHLFENENDKNKTERKRENKSNYNIYNIIPIINNTKEKMASIKGQKNKIFRSKNTQIKYDLNDLNQLFKKFSFSFQVPIDDFLLKNKKTSLLDKSIFKVCKNILDNYQELENKEDIFTYRSKSNSRPKFRAKSYNKNSDNSNYSFN